MMRNEAINLDKENLSEKDREYESLIRPKDFGEFLDNSR